MEKKNNLVNEMMIVATKLRKRDTFEELETLVERFCQQNPAGPLVVVCRQDRRRCRCFFCLCLQTEPPKKEKFSLEL